MTGVKRIPYFMQMARDLRERMSRLGSLITGADGVDQLWMTEIIAVPFIAKTGDIGCLAHEGDAIRQAGDAMNELRIHGPSVRFTMLEGVFTAHDLAYVAPEVIGDLRNILALSVLDPDAGERESYRKMAQTLAERTFGSPQAPAPESGELALGFLLGISFEPIDDTEDEAPFDRDAFVKDRTAAALTWRKKAMAMLNAEALLLVPVPYDSALADGMETFVDVMLALEWDGLNPDTTVPDPWGETHLYCWDDTLAIGRRHQGHLYGPVSLSADIFMPYLTDVSERFSAKSGFIEKHEFGVAPCLICDADTAVH